MNKWGSITDSLIIVYVFIRFSKPTVSFFQKELPMNPEASNSVMRILRPVALLLPKHAPAKLLLMLHLVTDTLIGVGTGVGSVAGLATAERSRQDYAKVELYFVCSGRLSWITR